MYTTYFGLKEKPFNLTPDPRFFYLYPRHRDVMNYLIYGITERKGFMVITGGIGTGKTTVSRALLANLDDGVDTALVFNPALSSMELLSTIVREFNVKMGRGRPTRKAYIDALNRFLLENFASGRNALLLIDEAQNLSPEVLEQIRMLSNLETGQEKLLQIVLMGQPELKTMLASPSLRQLNERIVVRYELKPLDRDQVGSYVRHRISVADGKGSKVRFTLPAQRLLYRASGGNPRRINALCDRALLIAYAGGDRVIDYGILRKAVRDMGCSYLGKRSVGRAFFGFGVPAVILAGAALVLWAGRSRDLWSGIRSLLSGVGLP